MQALADLRAANPADFTAIRASIRRRVSVRDLDNALRSFPPAAASSDGAEVLPYFEARGCIHRNAVTGEGPVPVALCNFSARIVEDLERDDGAEKTRMLAIEGTLADGTPLPRVEIAADSFPRMDWIVPAWGTRAVVFAGLGTKDHLRAALQLLSGHVPRRTVYRHTGWREIEDSWVYLHAGGAIGPNDPAPEVAVSLPEPLTGFELPDPPEGPELVDAVQASLGLLRLGPDRATFPLFAAIYRAVLGDTDFGQHLAGPTGCYKSEAAALAEQHYGATMDRLHLPANWASTGNALEGLAFVAKDVLLAVDDFCPAGSSADVQRYHREADRLFRGQGNRAGRLRMRADASLKPSKPPRGLVLSTGEDTPRCQSLGARMLKQDIGPGDFGPQPPHSNPTLTACQRDAAAGKYAAAMAGYIRWLAPQYEAIHNRLRSEIAELREKAAGDGQHARTPGNVASLALGLRYFLDFARTVGAIPEVEQAELWQRGWAALAQVAAAHAADILSGEPAALFLRLLSAAVASGRAHLASPDSEHPEDAQRWGWRPTGTEWQAQGRRIGWVDGDSVYLEPEAAYAEACELARQQGESFPITPNTLRRRLKDKGLLVTADTARGKLTVRKTLQGNRREVLHVVWPVARVGLSVDGAGIGPETCGPGGENGPKPWAENGHANGKPAQPLAPSGSAEHPSATAASELGQLGRSDTGEEGSAGENDCNQHADDWGEWR
jgi:hypothetical protein